ncbi:hypothetical protein IMCC3317_03230 [Kordia antarctica]|uniref:DUF3095 domain-containing protein n=1 Tax=Kordia antarctica TaxID=1218801 RepID=A0A7L4ZEG5_9FLAO|nr:DUF3095 domain-containing protein [Kordia antarctica]QHI34977.1 hypothetical protein IMCC3317_03230 [Kordia antarctica]
MKDFIEFYADLPKHFIPLRDLLKDESLFIGIPKNWHIVVTDIEGSSQAVANGKHNDINLVATGSIITVLNEIKTIDTSIKVPYFFGGDGATFIIPDAIISQVISALNTYSRHIKKTLELNLRVGSVILEEVYKNKVTARIAKLRHNKYLTTPIILGNGLKFAEAQIKANFKPSDINEESDNTIDLTGMECRWDEILPNGTDDKVVCLLVSCSDETKQAQVFKSIMDEINYLFGDLDARRPITAFRLKLNTSIEKIRKEMMTKIGKYDSKYLINNWLITLFGKYYFKFFPEGKRYLHSVTQLSDTIMLDGAINTVISGNSKQISKFQIFLDNLESQRVITYGIHITHSSIMSCYVQDRKENHIHFVDGTEGGYTSAAIAYKKKLKLSL